MSCFGSFNRAFVGVLKRKVYIVKIKSLHWQSIPATFLVGNKCSVFVEEENLVHWGHEELQVINLTALWSLKLSALSLYYCI